MNLTDPSTKTTFIPFVWKLLGDPRTLFGSLAVLQQTPVADSAAGGIDPLIGGTTVDTFASNVQELFVPFRTAQTLPMLRKVPGKGGLARSPQNIVLLVPSGIAV